MCFPYARRMLYLYQRSAQRQSRLKGCGSHDDNKDDEADCDRRDRRRHELRCSRCGRGIRARAQRAGRARIGTRALTERNDVQQLAWGGRRKSGGKRYSQGSMTTAAIAGAVVGAIIAKNT